MLTIERVVKNEEKIAFFRNMIVENNDFTDKVVLDLSRTGGLCTMFALKGKKKMLKGIQCIGNNKTFDFTTQ